MTIQNELSGGQISMPRPVTVLKWRVWKKGKVLKLLKGLKEPVIRH